MIQKSAGGKYKLLFCTPQYNQEPSINEYKHAYIRIYALQYLHIHKYNVVLLGYDDNNYYIILITILHYKNEFV